MNILTDECLVVEVRLLNRGCLKAFADISIASHFGELTIRGFRIIQKDGKEPWVGFPSISYVKDGKTITKPILDLPRGLQRHMAEGVLSAFEKARARATELPDRPQKD